MINFIAELKDASDIDGNYIILADNSCQAYRKIIQKYSASIPENKVISTLIIRDIKNLVLLKEDFKDYPGFFYLDSLEIYEQSQLTLPPAISIMIQGNAISYNRLELNGIIN